MTAALYTLFIINSVFLIFVVLLQSGRGGGLGEFGGSTGSAVFGTHGASTLLQKLTAWSAATFMVLSLVLALRSASNSITTDGDFVIEEPAAVTAPQVPFDMEQLQNNNIIIDENTDFGAPDAAPVEEAPAPVEEAAE